MPIFEYVCRKCEQSFEALVRGSEAPTCPACGGDELQKQFSAFAVSGSDVAAREPVGPCASCPSYASCGDPRGAGSRAMN